MNKHSQINNSLLSLLLGVASMSLVSCKTNEVTQLTSDAGKIEASKLPSTLENSEMFYPRAGHTAVKLNDGRVFVFGGLNEPSVDSAITEIFDPITNAWSLGPNLLFGDRGIAHAVLLPDGRVLIAGGTKLELEVFDPITNLITQVGSFAHSRNGASFTLLKNGDVLIAGGTTGDFPFTFFNDAELFDYKTESLRPAFNTMDYGRAGHTATLLPSGNVLIAGGSSGQVLTPTTILFNYSSEGFMSTNPLRQRRLDHFAFLLPNNEVLVAGGINNQTQVINLVETYHTYQAFEFDSDQPHGFYGAAAGQLFDGTPVITGGDNKTNEFGNNSIYIYNFAQNEFVMIGQMAQARGRHTLTVLDDDSILITGGWGKDTSLKSVERFGIK
jgi:hypothetical protein